MSDMFKKAMRLLHGISAEKDLISFGLGKKPSAVYPCRSSLVKKINIKVRPKM
jgi:hypothetical protein